MHYDLPIMDKHLTICDHVQLSHFGQDVFTTS